MTSALEAALDYCGRGWRPVPIPYRKKAPTEKGWQNLRITADTAPQYFNGAPQNIGVLLGEPSNDLVDVDLDSDEAIAAAPYFLPKTGAIFGRKSTPRAHYLYLARDGAPHTQKLNHPDPGDAKAGIVELRGTGGQTVFPGSTHETTGELIEWAEAGVPALVTRAELQTAQARIAVAATLATYGEAGTRDALCATAIGCLLRAGWSDEEIEVMVRAVVGAADDEKLDDRLAKIPRLRQAWLTNGGVGVYGYKNLTTLTNSKVAHAIMNWLGGSDDQTMALRGPVEAVGTYDEWHGIPYEAPVIVDRYLLEDAGGFVSPGGSGKTTTLSFEAVMIRLGRPLYGREVARPGPSLIITAEDRRAIMYSRLNKICSALELSPAEREHVRTGIFVEDISGSFAKLARADKQGRVEATPLLDEILHKYSAAGLATIALDPTSLIGPGESFGNDGMAELLRICRHISQTLGAAVRLVHHVSQAVARGGIQDQYVARGGTAFVDGSRFQHQLVTVKDREFKCEVGQFAIPGEATDDDLQQGRVLAILVHKLSYAERDRAPIFVLRRGFTFTHLLCVIAGPPSAAACDAASAADAESLRLLLWRKLGQGVRLSAAQVEAAYKDELGMSRARLRKAIIEAGRLGAIVETELPSDERSGARKTYLHPAEETPL